MPKSRMPPGKARCMAERGGVMKRTSGDFGFHCTPFFSAEGGSGRSRGLVCAPNLLRPFSTPSGTPLKRSFGLRTTSLPWTSGFSSGLGVRGFGVGGTTGSFRTTGSSRRAVVGGEEELGTLGMRTRYSLVSSSEREALRCYGWRWERRGGKKDKFIR